MFVTPVVMVVVLYWSKNRNTEADSHPVTIIAELDSRDATTAILKEANTVMNVSGKEKKCEKKKNEAAYSDTLIDHNDNSGDYQAISRSESYGT